MKWILIILLSHGSASYIPFDNEMACMKAKYEVEHSGMIISARCVTQD